MPVTKNNKKRSLAKVAMGSKRAKNTIGRMVREYVTAIDEKKFRVVPMFNSGTNTAVGATWLFVPILCDWNATPTLGDGIVQGTSANTRIGNRVKLQGIDIIVRITSIPANVGTAGSFCRMAVIHDKRSNGSGLPTGSNVFTTDNYLGVPNPVQEERYTVSQDSVHQMMLTTSTTGGPEGLFKIHIPHKSIIEYNGTNGRLGDIVGSNYFLGFVSDDADCCLIQAQATVHYTDD
jgi:hypothetical protein